MNCAFFEHTTGTPKYNIYSRRYKVKTINVSEAARQIGCSEKWLRDAEAKGKIPRAKRDVNNWRVFSELDIKVIKALLLPD